MEESSTNATQCSGCGLIRPVVYWEMGRHLCQECYDAINHGCKVSILEQHQHIKSCDYDCGTDCMGKPAIPWKVFHKGEWPDDDRLLILFKVGAKKIVPGLSFGKPSGAYIHTNVDGDIYQCNIDNYPYTHWCYQDELPLPTKMEI